MTAKVWGAIVKQWLVVALAGAVGYVFASGAIPAEYHAQALEASAALATVIASAYMSMRGKLEAEARGLLPATATPLEVEVQMVQIGYRRALFGLTRNRAAEERLAAVAQDLSVLKLRVDRIDGGQSPTPLPPAAA